MKAIIRLDVPEWQIGQDVTVFFPDTMMKKGVCEMLKEQEAIKPFSDDDGAYWCGSCHEDMVWHQKFCSNCGKPVLWEGR